MPNFGFRFYTGKHVWSAFLNITKCRVKGAPAEETRTRGGSSSRAGGGGASGGASGTREDEESCPLRLSVAARRPPDVLDPKTR